VDPRHYVETRTKRYMAQALEEFEREIERPLIAAAKEHPELDAIVGRIPGVKSTIRKRLQTLGSDCLDLIPPGTQINGFEPIVRR
jgi:hypothetical protein